MKSSRINLIALFFVIIFFEILLIAYLILNHRMVGGHDGFEWFVDQWYFVNGKVSHHEIPLWTPYMAHGQVTSYIYNRLGMFHNILMLFSAWIKNINFLPLFYLGLFFDKFILLTGTWLLARRYFKNPVTVFFVASTLVASTITFTQFTHTILLIYCLPLTLYLLHRFFDDWKWKWLFLSVFLFSVVSINIYYFISVFPLAVCVYFLVVFLCSKFKDFENFKIKKTDIIWVVAIGVIVSLMVGIFFLEQDPLISVHAPARQLDGQVSLSCFLTAGGGIYLFKWWEVFLGISRSGDYTLYLGLLTIPLIFIGTVSKNRNKYPFLIGALFFLLFSLGTPVASMAYYGWPMMKYFRHIGLITPLIKFYLCFLAGFGFEELFDFDKDQEDQRVYFKSLFSGTLLLMNGFFLSVLIFNPNLDYFFLSRIVHNSTTIDLTGTVINCLYYMICLSLIGSLIFLLRPTIKKYNPVYVLFIVLFQLISMYGYAYQQIQFRTFHLMPQDYALMEFQKIPFIQHRLVDDHQFPRTHLLNSLKGVLYDETYNFTFSDIVDTGFRSDISLKPYDKLSHLFYDKALSPVYLKLTGSSEDKIQFFSNAYPSRNVGAVIHNKSFAGDMLFYYLDPSNLQKGWFKGLDLSQNQRLNIPYKLLSFSPNQIEISVNVPQNGAWMQYCDAWHPQWKAEVNGRPQRIYLGSVAYKAIPLAKGINIVQFYFESNYLKAVYYYLMISSFIWMGFLIYLLISKGFV